MQAMAALARAATRKGAATVHGPGDYWRIMRQASEIAAMGESIELIALGGQQAPLCALRLPNV